MEQVRLLVLDVFSQHGNDDEDLQESILINGGFYCGRRFEAGGLSAVWFIEENQVKFYGRDGALVEVRETSAPTSANDVAYRKAA